VERVVFSSSQAEFFAGYGLRSFDDFFYYQHGKRVNKNKKRDVSVLSLGETNPTQVFIKRFHRPHLKDMFFTRCNFGRLCSQAACEWQNANALLEKGIQTYRPLCYGEKIICRLEKKSFIITEKLQGQSLSDFVTQNWLQLNQNQKEKIIVSMANQIRRIHDANISMPDLYIWHIFIKEKQVAGEWDFAFIDLHRMRQNVTDKNQKLKNLGRLDHSMTDKYFDETIRRLLIESYAGSSRFADISGLVDKVKNYSAAVSLKRKPKPY
jgi:tRNA A-37 threonylcarbamoyl transferase component Bud32